MKCEIGKHKIEVNYHAEFQCEICGHTFVLTYYDRNYIRLVRENLKKQIPHYWHYEWYKLLATRSLVRKLTQKLPPKSAKQIKLDPDRTYSYEDFSQKLEQIYYNED